MEGPEAVQRATELIEQRLAQEEETEVGARVKGGEGGLQVQGYICAIMGRERQSAAWVQAACYFPGPSQAHFHTRMFPTDLWVVRSGASAPQMGIWRGRPS